MKTKTQEALATQLENYKPFDEIEALHIEQLKQFLDDSSNPYDRSNLIAHVIADAWIVNPERDHIVLVEHRLSKVWVTPGGHCDGNPDVFSNAVREAHEETGLTNLRPLLGGNIFDINVAPVPTRHRHGIHEPAHMHFDVCYAFEAPNDAPLTISDESTDLRWVPLADINNLTTIPSHYRRPLKIGRL